MGKKKLVMGVLCLVAFGALAGTLVFAGPDGGGMGGPGGGMDGNGGPGGMGGPGGGFDREAMQERMLEMMKERLEISDDEWSIVKTRLQDVMTLQQSSRGGRMRGMFGPGGRRGRRGGQEETETQTSTDPVEIAASALQETLEKAEPTAAEIKAKLAAYRGARETNKQKLVTAQQKLKEVLTVKQEAMLVMMGMLD